MAPEETPTDMVARTAALAAMMTPEQRADLTMAMTLERAFEYLIQGGEPSVHDLNSPFNPDYAIHLVMLAGEKPEHGPDNRQAVIALTPHDTPETPHIIGALYSGALHGVSYVPGTDTPETPEPVQTARKSALAANQKIAQSYASAGDEPEAA